VQCLASRQRLVGLGCGAVMLLWAGLANAQGRAVVVRWSAPSGCPDEESVRARVAALAGPGAGLDAEGSMTAAAGGYRVVLRVRNGEAVGQRELEGASCGELAQSAALVLALSATVEAQTPATGVAADGAPPRAVAPPPPVVAPPVLAPAAVLASPAARSSAPAEAPRRARASWVQLAPVVAFDVGTLPSASIGGGLAIFVTPGHGIALGLKGAVWAGQSGTLAENNAQGANFKLVTADADGCYAVIHSPIELAPCAVVEVGHLSASGFQTTFAVPTATATWFALGLGARVRWELNRTFALGLEVEGVVPTQPQSFYIAAAGTVHVTAPVALRGYFGPEVRF
jgi:hypothetical protein